MGIFYGYCSLAMLFTINPGKLKHQCPSICGFITVVRKSSRNSSYWTRRVYSFLSPRRTGNGQTYPLTHIPHAWDIPFQWFMKGTGMRNEMIRFHYAAAMGETGWKVTCAYQHYLPHRPTVVTKGKNTQTALSKLWRLHNSSYNYWQRTPSSPERADRGGKNSNLKQMLKWGGGTPENTFVVLGGFWSPGRVQK